ncbi:SDR family NAD(P)-dependent oxidoreductase [Rhodococcus sp. SGAir0479]|uniref:SDR family NAD(P)-dependent oxidoreductase n=1 Tax=Rhodococcus sp. SGAir0479 TaxID=2567884 RepID=UPI001C2FDBF0|nr:SDR family NAD(P)-dependent oxidoreductase [Rhodococcus sp. SGAir0479]
MPRTTFRGSAVPLDVTDDDSVTAAAELIAEREGRLNVLVDNAGITGDTPRNNPPPWTPPSPEL